MSKCKVWLMPLGTRGNVLDLVAKNDVEAIKKLIEDGDLIPIDADAHTDSCGNFSHATIEATFKNMAE